MTRASISDPVSGWWIARTQIRAEPPPVFGVLAGTVAHLLYSALNHVVFALAVEHLGEAGAQQSKRDVGFPIATTKDEFDQLRVLERVSPDAIDVLRELQPYHRPAHDPRVSPLLLVREIADADKHRVLPASYGSVQLRNILDGVVFDWDETAASGHEFERTLPERTPGRMLPSGTDLVRLRFASGNEHAKLRLVEQPTASVVFQTDSWGGINMQSFGECVATVDRCLTRLATLFSEGSWPPANDDPLYPYGW